MWNPEARGLFYFCFCRIVILLIKHHVQVHRPLMKGLGTPQQLPKVWSRLRRTLFRGAWAEGSNTYYDEANSSSIWVPGLAPTYNPAATGTSVRQTKEDEDEKAALAAKKEAAQAKL